MTSDNANEPAESEIDRRNFLDRLGVVAGQDGRLVLEVGSGHLRSLGIAHGGVIASLLDSVMGRDANRTSPHDHYVVTAQLNVHFIRPGFDGETLIASSEIRHSGRKTAMAQGELRTASGELVAIASATFVYVPHTERTRAQPDQLDPTG